MADNKFDINKLKDNVGDLMGSLKSMINPAGATPNVDPDDALGLKIAKITTLIKAISDTQQDQVRKLNECNELLNGAFHDIEALRNSIKAQKEAAGVTTSAGAATQTTAAPTTEAPAVQPTQDEKK